MKIDHRWPALLAACVLAACGAPPNEGAEPGADGETGVLLESARRPLEKAGEVEDLAAGRKDALDAQIEGGDAAAQ